MIELIERSNIKDPAVVRALEYLVARLKGLLTQTFDQDGALIVASPSLAVVPVGAVQDFAGETAPTGWLLCDGATVSRVKYADLFRVIGTTYGAGDGSTTFTLPDVRGRFALGKAATGTGDALGETGGELDHVHTIGSHTHAVGTLATSSAGSHAHTVNSHAHNYSGTTGGPSAQTFADDNADGIRVTPASGGHTHFYSGSTDASSPATDSQGAHTHPLTGSTGSSAGGDSGEANPAYIVFNKIIFVGVP